VPGPRLRQLRGNDTHMKRAQPVPKKLGISLGATAAACVAIITPVLAATAGKPEPGQIGFQEAVTPIAHELHTFHDALLLPITTLISLFVLGLLVTVVVRFNEKANPVPSKTTHHTGLEVAWTVVPVLILVIIAIPSFRLLNHQLIEPKAEVTMKVTGKMWNWSYDYPKEQNGPFGFDSIMKPDAELKPEEGDIRQLSVDNEAVLPVDTVVRLEVTSADVIHSFVVQSFGVRMDAVPGRLNTIWFNAEREGIYYGQCSKLCGKDHAFMPIAIRIVSKDKYAAWLQEAKKKFAASGKAPVAVADAAEMAR
jgi:cytochrome c oxidase subunit II